MEAAPDPAKAFVTCASPPSTSILKLSRKVGFLSLMRPASTPEAFSRTHLSRTRAAIPLTLKTLSPTSFSIQYSSPIAMSFSRIRKRLLTASSRRHRSSPMPLPTSPASIRVREYHDRRAAAPTGHHASHRSNISKCRSGPGAGATRSDTTGIEAAIAFEWVQHPAMIRPPCMRSSTGSLPGSPRNFMTRPLLVENRTDAMKERGLRSPGVRVGEDSGLPQQTSRRGGGPYGTRVRRDRLPSAPFGGGAVGRQR